METSRTEELYLDDVITPHTLNAACNLNKWWNSIGYDDANDYTMHIRTMI